MVNITVRVGSRKLMDNITKAIILRARSMVKEY